MNYQQTLDYLYTRLPMFQRIGSAAYKANLDNTIAICKLLDNPENKFRSVHIAGTNGKGSTSHMIASVLQCAGYKVGLYTSPHLKDFRERIRINGEMIPEKNVVDFVEKYRTDFEKIDLSFFEMTVGLAFDHFANEKVDVAIIEVGLGGRLDSTNVIRPEVSVITNISFDHTFLLGDTIEKIALEKAGIIKENIPVVIGESENRSKGVFTQKAQEQNADIIFADQIYQVEGELKKAKVRMNRTIIYEELESGLLGNYQKKNIATVLTTLDVLKEKGFRIKAEQVHEGIRDVVKQTGLLGRWQTLSTQPLVVADTGHNEAGIMEVLDQLKQTPHDQLHFVIGMVNDKDVSKILSLLPKDANYYFCKANIPRALAAEDLKEQANEKGLKGEVYLSVSDALKNARQNAGENDLVFVGGSSFIVAEVV